MTIRARLIAPATGYTGLQDHAAPTHRPPIGGRTMPLSNSRTTGDFAVSGINHLALVCSDMQRTVDFYTQVLGFPLIKTIELPRRARPALLLRHRQRRQPRLLLVPRRAPAPPRRLLARPRHFLRPARRADHRRRLDEPRRLRRAAGADRRIPRAPRRARHPLHPNPSTTTTRRAASASSSPTAPSCAASTSSTPTASCSSSAAWTRALDASDVSHAPARALETRPQRRLTPPNKG